ncbi:MAG: LuxR C-terminal-related transcriptional regulator [Sphingomonadales bacterium]
MIVVAFPEIAELAGSRILDDYADSRGWSGYICSVEGARNGRRDPGLSAGAVSSSARGLIEQYTREEYLEDDPVRCWIMENGRPVIWTVDEFRHSQNRRQRKLFSLVADAGFRSGVSIPLFGPSNLRGSLVALAASDRIDVGRAIEEVKESGPLGNAFIGCACRRGQSAMAFPALTGREVECLSWVAMGKTSWEISLILGISPRTADFHVQNAMAKLDASSRQQAIYNALSLGVLPCPMGARGAGG